MFHKIYISGVLLSTCIASSFFYKNESEKKNNNLFITSGKSILTAGFSSLIWPLFVPIKTIHCYHSYIKNKE